VHARAVQFGRAGTFTFGRAGPLVVAAWAQQQHLSPVSACRRRLDAAAASIATTDGKRSVTAASCVDGSGGRGFPGHAQMQAEPEGKVAVAVETEGQGCHGFIHLWLWTGFTTVSAMVSFRLENLVID